MYRKKFRFIVASITLLIIGGCGSGSGGSKSDTPTPTPTVTPPPTPTVTPSPTPTVTPTPTPIPLKLSFISKNKITVNKNQIKVVSLKATGSDKFNYFIDGGDSHYFDIDQLSGAIYFKEIHDKAEKSSYSFNAIAMDSDGKKVEQILKIDICNSSECRKDLPSKLMFTSPETVMINENSTQPIWIGAEAKSKISFKIEGEDSRYFIFNKNTGRLIFKNIPNYEDKTSYKLMVTIKDSNRGSEIQFLTIKVVDIDENGEDDTKPKFATLDTINIQEGQKYVMKLYAIDKNRVTYSIRGDDANIFHIDNKTGEITFKDTPNYNDKSTFKFTAVAQDSHENGTTKEITVNLLDVEDSTPPEFAIPSTISVEENERYVMTVVAMDESDVKYSIGGIDSNHFEINRETGYLNFTHNPDYETKQKYSINITAEDSVGLKSVHALTINIKDISETIYVKRISQMAGFWRYDDGGYTSIESNGDTIEYFLTEDNCYGRDLWKIYKSLSREDAFYYQSIWDSNYSTDDFTAKVDDDILTIEYEDGSIFSAKKSTKRSSIISNLCY